MAELWVEKYRPQSLNEYVWRDADQRKKVEEWIKEGSLPHLLFTGVQGTGKTSLAKLLLKELNIPKGDILEINASRERLADTVQEKIVNFVQTWALGPTGVKYVLLDEADKMSPLAQGMLRGEMEKYHDVARFILTCNYGDKIIPALHSRLQGFQFKTLDQDDYIARVGEVLTRENVDFDVETLLAYVSRTYPDLRKCIGLVQQNVVSGKLLPPKEEEAAVKDYLVDTVALFKAGRYLEARKLITSQAQIEEYVDIYRFFYRNLELFGETTDQQDNALLIIRKGLVNHAVAADPEINLAACLVELVRLIDQ